MTPGPRTACACGRSTGPLNSSALRSSSATGRYLPAPNQAGFRWTGPPASRRAAPARCPARDVQRAAHRHVGRTDAALHLGRGSRRRELLRARLPRPELHEHRSTTRTRASRPTPRRSPSAVDRLRRRDDALLLGRPAGRATRTAPASRRSPLTSGPQSFTKQSAPPTLCEPDRRRGRQHARDRVPVVAGARRAAATASRWPRTRPSRTPSTTSSPTRRRTRATRPTRRTRRSTGACAPTPRTARARGRPHMVGRPGRSRSSCPSRCSTRATRRAARSCRQSGGRRAGRSLLRPPPRRARRRHVDVHEHPGARRHVHQDDRSRRVHLAGAREFPRRTRAPSSTARTRCPARSRTRSRSRANPPRRPATAASSSAGTRGRAPTTTASRSPPGPTSHDLRERQHPDDRVRSSAHLAARTRPAARSTGASP